MRDIVDSILLHLPQQNEEPFLIAIDGRCAAGKTTLAALLAAEISCHVIPLDHFFLQPHQRTKERLAQPGSNVDYERFADEILSPIRQDKTPDYRPFNCQTMQMDTLIHLPKRPFYILEGSYSCHPALFPYYDLTIFLTTDPLTQMQRITTRNGPESAATFATKWIPLEELYLTTYPLAHRCTLTYST